MGINLGIAFRAAAAGAVLVLLPLATAAVMPNQALISLNESGSPARIGMGSPLASDKMMMPNPFSYNYLAGPDLSEETGLGHIYRLSLNLAGDPQSVLKRVAAVMEVEGEISKADYYSEENPAYVIGSQDGTNESVSINWTGTGNWWYSNPAAWKTAMPVCSGEKDEAGNEICNGPEPTPELLPSRDEMIIEALRVFNATGFEVSEQEIRTDINDWGASAYASMKIGGQDSPIEWLISWGSNGKVGQVSGHTVSVQDLGEYKTISAVAAVARMGDWRYSGAVAQSVWTKYQPPSDGRVIAYGEATDDQPIAVGEPAPTPTVINVQITKAVPTPMMIWDQAGTVWIVPGYLLIAEEGWLNPVFSLEDGVVTLPEPMEISPMVK